MKYECKHCGKLFSDKVINIHESICKPAELSVDNMNDEDLRAYAKEQGVSHWHMKSRETLLNELKS